MSAKLDQLILCAEVQLKIYLSIFDCANVELLQVYFRYTLNISHLKTVQKSYSPHLTLKHILGSMLKGTLDAHFPQGGMIL